MIRLTRLSGQEFIVNAELIKYVEETPDTIVTLRSGDKILVQESPDLVVERAVDYARRIRLVPGLE
jgi:flagellar protein FlbD